MLSLAVKRSRKKNSPKQKKQSQSDDVREMLDQGLGVVSERILSAMRSAARLVNVGMPAYDRSIHG
jgi:hypothetical protein